MAQLLYLLLAMLLSAAGTVVIWFRHRRPRSLESGIEEFARELRALSPEHRSRNRDESEDRAG